jgi:hypothetical protein
MYVCAIPVNFYIGIDFKIFLKLLHVIFFFLSVRKIQTRIEPINATEDA